MSDERNGIDPGGGLLGITLGCVMALLAGVVVLLFGALCVAACVLMYRWGIAIAGWLS